MNIIRYLFKTLTSLTGSRIFTATGRADEEIRGRMFQHYGFRSSPPANIEGVSIKYDNNIVSVAENDAQAIGDAFAFGERDTALYTVDSNGKLDNYFYLESDGNVSLNASNSLILETGDGDIVNLPGGVLNKVLLGDIEGNTYYLVTKEFLTFFINHTHTSATPGSPTSTPLYPGTTPITEAAIQAANGITITTKAK